MSGRDYQKSKVYAWENQHIANYGGSPRIIGFEEAQRFVDGVWLANGWLYPPRIHYRKATKNIWANAHRGIVNMPDQLPAWVLLHEISHSLTTTSEGDTCDYHGANFVGVYIKLLDKILNIPLPYIMYTLAKAGVEYNLGAKPVFLDGR